MCGSNLRQFGIAFTQYSQDYESWFPVKSDPNDPNASPMALRDKQKGASSQYGPSFSGIIRDVVERAVTREGGGPEFTASTRYLHDPKVMLCPNDRFNNRPNPPPGEPDKYPTESANSFLELPRTLIQETTAKKSRASYVYITMLRNDDKSEFLLMSEQSNVDDTSVNFLTKLDQDDNHGTRGINALFLDTHVEWVPCRSGSFNDVQQMAIRLFAPLSLAKPRWGGSSRAEEIQTIE